MEVYKKYHFVIFTFFFRIERKYRCKVIEPDSDAVELSDDVKKNYSNNEKQTIVTKIHQWHQHSVRGRDEVQGKVLNRFFDCLISN